MVLKLSQSHSMLYICTVMYLNQVKIKPIYLQYTVVVFCSDVVSAIKSETNRDFVPIEKQKNTVRY